MSALSSYTHQFRWNASTLCDQVSSDISESRNWIHFNAQVCFGAAFKSQNLFIFGPLVIPARRSNILLLKNVCNTGPQKKHWFGGEKKRMSLVQIIDTRTWIYTFNREHCYLHLRTKKRIYSVGESGKKIITSKYLTQKSRIIMMICITACACGLLTMQIAKKCTRKRTTPTAIINQIEHEMPTKKPLN